MTDKKNKKSKKDKNVSSEEKIKSLQEMITNAERTIISAKQMLAKLEGNKAGLSSERNGLSFNSQENQNGQKIIYGNFDGQIMIGEDGKQYPVPANYASKSKLVEGDTLKLTITPDGSFVYKQVGPVERKYLMGIVRADEKGNHFVNAEGRKYKVLLAAATYFKIEPGDEVTIVVPRDKPCIWGAIENVLRKAEDISEEELENYQSEGSEKLETEDGNKREFEIRINNKQESPAEGEEEEDEELEEDLNTKKPSAIEKLEKEMEEERKKSKIGSDEDDNEEEDSEDNEDDGDNKDIFNEWEPDIEQLKKEANYPAKAAKE